MFKISVLHGNLVTMTAWIWFLPSVYSNVYLKIFFMRKPLLNRYIYVFYPLCVAFCISVYPYVVIKTTFSREKLVTQDAMICHLTSVYYSVFLRNILIEKLISKCLHLHGLSPVFSLVRILSKLSHQVITR